MVVLVPTDGTVFGAAAGGGGGVLSHTTEGVTGAGVGTGEDVTWCDEEVGEAAGVDAGGVRPETLSESSTAAALGAVTTVTVGGTAGSLTGSDIVAGAVLIAATGSDG